MRHGDLGGRASGGESPAYGARSSMGYTGGSASGHGYGGYGRSAHTSSGSSTSGSGGCGGAHTTAANHHGR